MPTEAILERSKQLPSALVHLQPFVHVQKGLYAPGEFRQNSQVPKQLVLLFAIR